MDNGPFSRQKYYSADFRVGKKRGKTGPSWKEFLFMFGSKCENRFQSEVEKNIREKWTETDLEKNCRFWAFQSAKEDFLKATKNWTYRNLQIIESLKFD